MTLHRLRIPVAGVVKVETLDTEAPELKPQEVLVEPRYLGICGSDLHALHGRHPVGKPPLTPGHEMCARVVAVGSAVTHVTVGDLGIVDPIVACGECRACRAGRPNLCEPPNVAGFRAPGYGQSWVVVPEANVHVAPQTVPAEDLILAEPVACASHCVGRVPDHLRDDVLVIGAGTIGQTIVQALRITGVGNLTVVELDDRKRELAIERGADEAYGQVPADRRFAAVIDVVAIQPTLDAAFAAVIPGGRVVMMGVPSGSLAVPAPALQRFERDLVGSGMYVPADFDRAVAWIADGSFDTRGFVTSIHEFDRAADAFAAAQLPESIKTLIRINPEENR